MLVLRIIAGVVQFMALCPCKVGVDLLSLLARFFFMVPHAVLSGVFARLPETGGRRYVNTLRTGRTLRPCSSLWGQDMLA